MYSIAQICKALNAKCSLDYGDHDLIIRYLSIDSRKISMPAETLFIALSSKRQDGHDYIQQARQNGIRCFMVSRVINFSDFPECIFIQVEDCLKALQNLAAYHRKQFHLEVVAITGSNGKTVVKEWINQLLAADKSIIRSPRSYNSQIGVPLSVWNISIEHEIGLFEAGISKPGEMLSLERIIQPDVGLFLNIGEAHIENFESKSTLAAEKAILFKNCKRLVANADDELLMNSAKTSGFKGELVTWSMGSSRADLRVMEKTIGADSSVFKLDWKGKVFEIEIPFTDEASSKNALATSCFLLDGGMAEDILTERIAGLNSVEMRLELLEGINGSRIINDSYSADLYSLKIALDFLDQQAQGRKKIVILSDFEQTGLSESALYNSIAELMQAHKIDILIAAGISFRNSEIKFINNTTFYNNTDELLEGLNPEQMLDSLILVKGARRFRFERIIKRLQEKAHDTVLEIDLGKVQHNLNLFRNEIGGTTGIMAMVKAFSYGSGSIEIAKILEYQKVAYLAVAYTDEGVSLRRAGISLPILVLNPERSSYESIIQYRLEPEIYSLTTLKNFKKELSFYTGKWPWPVHIKLETGMNRLGFSENELNELCAILKQSKELKVVSVFSHLAASEDETFDLFSLEQIAKFERMSSVIQSALQHTVLRHLANSAGMLRFPQSRYDMVRLGIGLYGIEPIKEELGLKPVSTLRTIISQVRDISAGSSVGYGRSFIAKEAMQIAILPIGYADGYRRSLGQGKAWVSVSGEKCKVIGNVCMDMLMIDVSGLHVKEGDDVIVFGDSPTVLELSQWAGSIAYEILTSISPRVKRVFIQE